MRRRATSRTSAGKLGMESDLFRLETEHLADHHLVHRLELRRHPRFRLVTVESDGRVEWLHRRVGQKRKLILGNDAIPLGNTIERFRVATVDRDVAVSAG